VFLSLFNNPYYPASFLLFFQALFFGGEGKLPSFLARHTIPGIGIVVDPCAAALVVTVTVLLCIGIKEVPFPFITFEAFFFVFFCFQIESLSFSFSLVTVN